MKNRSSKHSNNLKKYFFIRQYHSDPLNKDGSNEEEKQKLAEYLESYQQVTRWK